VDKPVGLAAFDVIIDATSASFAGELPPVSSAIFAPGCLAYDVVYGKGETSFLELARSSGAGKIVDGRGMLVEQAADAFYWWRGVRPETRPVLEMLPADGARWIESDTWYPRLTAAMILSGSPAHERGLELWLVSATKRLMALWRSTVDRKTPRLSRRLESLAKKPSTALSQEQEVGTTWKTKRSCRSSHARTFGCMWAAYPRR
jgi:hypothetical protein